MCVVRRRGSVSVLCAGGDEVCVLYAGEEVCLCCVQGEMKWCVLCAGDELCVLCVQEEMKRVETSLAALKQQQDGLQQREQKLQSENIEIKHELEKYESVIKDNHAKVKHWTKEVRTLSNTDHL